MQNPHDPNLLSAYLDGELDPSEAAQVVTHLAACDTCQRQLATWQALREQVWRLTPELPVDLPLRIMGAIPPQGRLWQRVALLSGTGAGFGLALLLLLLRMPTVAALLRHGGQILGALLYAGWYTAEGAPASGQAAGWFVGGGLLLLGLAAALTLWPGPIPKEG